MPCYHPNLFFMFLLIYLYLRFTILCRMERITWFLFLFMWEFDNCSYYYFRWRYQVKLIYCMLISHTIHLWKIKYHKLSRFCKKSDYINHSLTHQSTVVYNLTMLSFLWILNCTLVTDLVMSYKIFDNVISIICCRGY
jgi:hypothetical protein